MNSLRKAKNTASALLHFLARLAALERELGFDDSSEEYTSDEEELNDENIDNLTEEQKEKIRVKMINDEKLIQEKMQEKLIHEKHESSKKVAFSNEDEYQSPESEIEEETQKLSKKAKKRLKQRQKEESQAYVPVEIPTEKVEKLEIDETENLEKTEEKAITPQVTPVKLSAKEKRRIREKQKQDEAAKKKDLLKVEEKLELNCKMCGHEFPSRTKLFDHIKEVCFSC